MRASCFATDHTEVLVVSKERLNREHVFIAFIYISFRLAGELLFFQQRKKSNQKNAVPGARASHALSHLHCPRVVLTRIPARQDSIDRPWSIDPISEAVFGELNGRNSFPVKFAEAFGFGRENQAGRLI
jgi:hypothetical protein